MSRSIIATICQFISHLQLRSSYRSAVRRQAQLQHQPSMSGFALLTLQSRLESQNNLRQRVVRPCREHCRLCDPPVQKSANRIIHRNLLG